LATNPNFQRPKNPIIINFYFYKIIPGNRKIVNIYLLY